MEWSYNTILIQFAACILVAAMIYDLVYKKIPNVLTFSTMIAALGYHGLVQGVGGFFFSLVGLVLGIAILLVPYQLGGMGAGDVKLLGAVGAVLGPTGVFNAFVLTALAGGIYVLLILVVHHRYTRCLISRFWFMVRAYGKTGQFVYIPADDAENRRKPSLCYGVAIGLGTLSTMGWFVIYKSFPVVI